MTFNDELDYRAINLQQFLGSDEDVEKENNDFKKGFNDFQKIMKYEIHMQILPACYYFPTHSFFCFFAIKLGRFIENTIIVSVANTQA